MRLVESVLWQRDLDLVIESLPELKQLEGKTVLVVGATGLICSSIIDLFIRYNETHLNKINIIGLGRSIQRMSERFGKQFELVGGSYVEYDTCSNKKLDCEADYIIYGASNASPQKYTYEPVETILGNFLGTYHLLLNAKDKGCKNFLYISSSEVYGKKENNAPYKEEEYGYIDLLNIRNSYSSGKRATEALCVGFSKEYGIHTVIARPGHVYGPTAALSDQRVSSSWFFDAVQGNDIIMKSEGRQLRSYCYCIDCASALLMLLIKGDNCQAYNISNPNSVITVSQLATKIANCAGVSVIREAPTQEEQHRFNTMDNSSLDSSKLLLLGWNCLFDSEKGISHTIQVLNEIMGKNK